MLEPVYPLTAGLSAKMLGKLSRQAIEQVPQFTEWLPSQLLQSRHWPSFNDAIQHVHKPADPTDVSTAGLPWQRLSYGELLKTAFDLYRWDALKSLHLDLPPDLESEKKLWGEIGGLLYRNYPLKTPWKHG